MMQKEMTRRALLSGLVTTVPITMLPTSAFAASLAQTFKPQGQSVTINHDTWNTILRTYVKQQSDGLNLFDYAGCKSGAHPALKAYVNDLQKQDPTKLSTNEAFAYWANLYNAATIDVVLDAYPVKSIKDINLGGGGFFGSGPWSKAFLKVNGTTLSLDDIEHKILRGGLADNRVHYALNCASYSCPNLASNAYTGTNLKALLAENRTSYINHPRAVSINNGRITASKIYSWYAGDFGGKRNLKAHWQQYASAQKAKEIKAASLGSFVYDWSLNAS